MAGEELHKLYSKTNNDLNPTTMLVITYEQQKVKDTNLYSILENCLRLLELEKTSTQNRMPL